MTADLNWRYIAEDHSGKIIRGDILASDTERALSQLRKLGLTPISLNSAPDQVGRRLFNRRQKRLSQGEATLFCARMADLLSADVPVAKALSLISAQSSSKTIAPFVERLQNKIRNGAALSKALAEDPSSPPPLMIALVASGEALGDLSGQFDRLARSFETRAALQKEIISQLIYPIALFVLIILTMVFLSFFVLPQFETVFLTADASPPAETQFVLAAGAFIRSYWLVVSSILFFGVIGLKIFIQNNRTLWERFKARSFFSRRAIRKINTARYCRSLGELLCGGCLWHAPCRSQEPQSQTRT